MLNATDFSDIVGMLGNVSLKTVPNYGFGSQYLWYFFININIASKFQTILYYIITIWDTKVGKPRSAYKLVRFCRF